MAEPGLPAEPAGLPSVAEEEGESEGSRCPAQRADQLLADEVAELRRRVKKQESRISELAAYAGVVQKESVLAIQEKVEQLCARSSIDRSGLESPEAERPAEEDETRRRLPADERLNALVELQVERRLAEELAVVRQQVQEALAVKTATEGFAQVLAVEMKQAFEALRSDLQLQGAEGQAGLSTLQVQMEGYRLQAVGCEASLADLRAELDTRRGIDEQAMQRCLSGVCHELRETQMSQMRALLDHGEKLDACGYKVQEQGSRSEQLEAAVSELSRCLVDIGSRLRDLKECVSGGGEDKADFAVLGLRLQALEHLLGNQRSQKAGAEDAAAPPADQLQQATAPEAFARGSSSRCPPTGRPSPPTQQPSVEASRLPLGASAAAALAVVAAVPSSPQRFVGQAAEVECASRCTGAAGPMCSSTQTLTPDQTTPKSPSERRKLAPDFEAAAATDEAAAARSRAAQQHPGVGVGVVRSRSVPGLQGASKPQPTPQQQVLARQSVALPWPQRFSSGSHAQGQLITRQASAAWPQQAPSRPLTVQRSGSPVPLRGPAGGALASEAAAMGQPAPSLMRAPSAAALLGTSPTTLAPTSGASPPGPSTRGTALLNWQRQQLPLRRIGA